MDASQQPLVSVIAISYNHAPYIQLALESVFHQTYLNIELIIADDGSTDTSVDAIQRTILGRKATFLPANAHSVGNCALFNQAFAVSKGTYIIDFALDDLMHPERIAKQVAFFEQLDAATGVVFTNADIINEAGIVLGRHYPRYHHKKSDTVIPQGEVFADLLSRYYINPVTMMIRREVFESLNGYDATLAYEDFDFWIRSSRTFQYAYLNEVLSSKRNVPQSLSAGFSSAGKERMFVTTLRVCEKAWWLCRNKKEIHALVQRCRYEWRQASRYNYTSVAKEYEYILKETDPWYRLYKPFLIFFR